VTEWAIGPGFAFRGAGRDDSRAANSLEISLGKPLQFHKNRESNSGSRDGVPGHWLEKIARVIARDITFGAGAFHFFEGIGTPAIAAQSIQIPAFFPFCNAE